MSKKNVLIVDDSKIILELLENEISKKIENINIFKATTLKEALEYIQNKKIYAAVLDLNLPDAQNTQIVDYALEKKIPSIVLTGILNKDLKELILQKNIVDYVIKDNNASILKVAHTVDRILRNYDTNVIVAEDSAPELDLLKSYLKEMKLNVFSATNGEEVIDLIEKKDRNYSLVITDYYMPKLDGMELTFYLRQRYKKDQLGIIAISSSEESNIATNFIKAGADDYIKKPFTLTELQIRVNSRLELITLFEENYKYQQNLEKRVQEEIEKNRKQEEQIILQSRNAAMGQMMSAIVHQWKQPLNIISIANNDVNLEIELGSFSEDICKEHIKLIDSQVEYMIQTIEDFRDFFRPKPKEKYCVSNCIKKVYKMTGKAFANRNVFIKLDLEKDLFTYGYQNELAQVIINLLNNARDVICEKNPKVRNICVSSTKDDKSCIINVIDCAGGIPENIIDKIFEPYFTTKGDNKGTGIGLDMSKTIIEKVGGTITAQNTITTVADKEYKGAKFTITLPKAN